MHKAQTMRLFNMALVVIGSFVPFSPHEIQTDLLFLYSLHILKKYKTQQKCGQSSLKQDLTKTLH